MAITLKPAHLGEMLVRFTQAEGEMLVKILVTTQVAKDMLEGNMQQLRHMFSPHQVVIERQDALVQQNHSPYKEESQYQEHESKERQSSEHEDTEENESFSSLFEELLLNEKV